MPSPLRVRNRGYGARAAAVLQRAARDVQKAAGCRVARRICGGIADEERADGTPERDAADGRRGRKRDIATPARATSGIGVDPKRVSDADGFVPTVRAVIGLKISVRSAGAIPQFG